VYSNGKTSQKRPSPSGGLHPVRAGEWAEDVAQDVSLQVESLNYSRRQTRMCSEKQSAPEARKARRR